MVEPKTTWSCLVCYFKNPCLYLLSFLLPSGNDFIRILCSALNRGSDTSGHFIWNLWNEPLASFINFIRNDHECKIPFIIWPLIKENLSPPNLTLVQCEKHCWHGRCHYAPKRYFTCGHTIFMTWRYPLNNSDAIW